MKPTSRLNGTLFHRSLTTLLLSATLLVSATAASADGEGVIRGADGLAYVSGGVGEESQARLDAMAGDFNLKLLFAMKSGAYLSNIRVTIANGPGLPLVDATSAGPWFLAKLPVGHYRVVANYQGEAIGHEVTIGAGKTGTLDFRWPAR